MLRQNRPQQIHDMLVEVVNRTEVLMNDNALLQRQIYKYETAAAEVDSALKTVKAEIDLKRLCEQ